MRIYLVNNSRPAAYVRTAVPGTSREQKELFKRRAACFCSRSESRRKEQKREPTRVKSICSTERSCTLKLSSLPLVAGHTSKTTLIAELIQYSRHPLYTFYTFTENIEYKRVQIDRVILVIMSVQFSEKTLNYNYSQNRLGHMHTAHELMCCDWPN